MSSIRSAKASTSPILIKGIMTAEEAETAVKRGIQGIIVSNYGGLLTPGMVRPMEMLSAHCRGRRRQSADFDRWKFPARSDIFKALATEPLR